MDHLNAIISAQRDRIEELEGLLGLKIEVPAAFRLTKTHRDMLGLLLSRNGIVSRDSFFVVLYGASPECDWPDIKIIDVQMCKLRALLKSACKRAGVPEIEIATDWGKGYYIAPADKERLRALIGGEA